MEAEPGQGGDGRGVSLAIDSTWVDTGDQLATKDPVDLDSGIDYGVLDCIVDVGHREGPGAAVGGNTGGRGGDGDAWQWEGRFVGGAAVEGVDWARSFLEFGRLVRSHRTERRLVWSVKGIARTKNTVSQGGDQGPRIEGSAGCLNKWPRTNNRRSWDRLNDPHLNQLRKIRKKPHNKKILKNKAKNKVENKVKNKAMKEVKKVEVIVTVRKMKLMMMKGKVEKKREMKVKVEIKMGKEVKVEMMRRVETKEKKRDKKKMMKRELK
ncbi:hypothetical protein Scep_010433 [Stephania cephalantha]|uniref:Uncharacterized protein n=1 Tax=Stephania cephalantha TaxID=152367 RepID=A0AAP0PE43_9MAGN